MWNDSLSKLMGGAEEWNKWRRSIEEMGRVDIYRAEFSRADLSNADLSGVNLSQSILLDTNLSHAKLSGANFFRANLTNTNLSGTELTNATLTSAILSGTKFNRSLFSNTTFSDVDLRGADGLETIRHAGPSEINISTIFRAEEKIPEAFLRGCGVPEPFIIHLPSLVAAVQPIQFYSCFISYSSKDQKFAEWLHADLQNKGVRCWYAPHDLKIGEKLRVGIDESIRFHDKLLLILSKNSIESEWVEKEVETVMEREHRQKRTILCPIRLDDAVLKVESGWAADVRRSRNIGDFRRWKGHDTYSKAFERLLRDLQAKE